MSVQLSQPNIEYKKQKPGLKLSGGSVSRNLKTALSGLKASTNTQTGHSTAVNTNTTTSAPKNALALAVTKNLNTGSTYNIFSDGSYDHYNNRVGGTRSVWTSDYRRDNVRNAFGLYSDNPMALAPRTQARQNSLITKYFEMQQRMLDQMMDHQRCMDKAELFNNISQGLLGAGNIAIELIKARASQAPATETDATVNQLRQADTSSEISEGINELNDQKTNLNSDINTLTQSINESNDIKAKNEADLSNKESTLSQKEQNLNGYNSTITKLQSNIATGESELKRLEQMLNNAQDGSLSKTGLQNQYDKLKKEIETNKQNLKEAQDNKKQTEEEVKKLKDEIATLKTTISNTNERLAEDTKKLASSKEQLNDVDSAITKYTQKLDKKEESESEKLDKMRNDLAQYKKDYEAETDPDKKAKIKEKFDQKASEYNNLATHSNVKGHAAITMSLGA